MHYPASTTDTKATAIATIETARALDESTVDLRQDPQTVQAMFEAFRAGTLYDDTEEPALDALSAQGMTAANRERHTESGCPLARMRWPQVARP